MVSIHTKIFLRQRLMYFSCKLNSCASQCKAGNKIPRVHHKHFVGVCVSYLSIMTNSCILCMVLSWNCHKIHRQGSISEVSLSYLKEQVYIYFRKNMQRGDLVRGQGEKIIYERRKTTPQVQLEAILQLLLTYFNAIPMSINSSK